MYLSAQRGFQHKGGSVTNITDIFVFSAVTSPPFSQISPLAQFQLDLFDSDLPERVNRSGLVSWSPGAHAAEGKERKAKGIWAFVPITSKPHISNLEDLFLLEILQH